MLVKPNIVELVQYIKENEGKLWCSICSRWTTNDQSEWLPCCYYYRSDKETLAYVQWLAKNVVECKPIKFTCHGNNSPAYGCNVPEDQSGVYVKIGEISGGE